MKVTPLDKHWQHLMSLCESEAKFRAEPGRHVRMLKLLSADIERVASELGFGPRQIATRDFRAERDGDHIVRIISD